MESINKSIKHQLKLTNRFFQSLERDCITKKSYLKLQAEKIVSLLIILCLLTLSTPASPQVLVENVTALRQNLLISLKVNDFLSVFSFSSKSSVQETQEERDANVTRIEIDSNNSIYPTGKKVFLFAVGYDQNNNPVTGVNFEWEAEDPDGKKQEVIDDFFTAKSEGEYRIKVRGAGQEATGKFIIKNPTEFWKDYDSNSGNLILPFEEWDVNNIPHARNIRNQRGNPPGKPKGKINFNIAAPVLSVPGRGLNVDLSLYYNSLVWSRLDQDISYDMDKDWLAPGWNIGYGKIVNIINGGIVQFDADGTRRFFAGPLNGANDTVPFQGQSTDGTFIKNFTQTSVLSNGQCFYNPATYLKYPDGTTIWYDALESRCFTISEPITMAPKRIQDRHGNQITITYYTPSSTTPPGRWINQIKDTLGRTYTFNYALDNGRYYLTDITGQGLPDENGNTVTRTFVRLQYKNHTITHNFSGLTPHVRESNIKVLSAIYYPATQSGYWFGDSDSYSPYGMIRKVDEHRAMTYSPQSGISITQNNPSRRRVYTYPTETNTALTDTPSFSTVTDSWEGMTTAPSTTDYEVNWDANPRTTTTIASDGSRVVEYSYNLSALNDNNQEKAKDGLTYKTEVFVGSETTPRSRSEIEWELGHAVNSCVGQPTGCLEVKIPRPKKITQSQFENGTTFTKITSNDAFGEYNQVTEMTEIGYGGSNDVLRKTVTEYVKKGDSPTGDDQWRALPRLINLPAVVQIFDGNNNRIGYSKNEYDLNPVEQFSGSNPPNFCVDFYCAGITERGNLSKTTTYENVTNSVLSGELSNSLVYDRAGNLVKQKPEVTSNTLNTYKYTANTWYTYPEETTVSSDNAGFANLSVKTTATFNFNTGLPLSATDANLQTVEYKHNSDTWRLEKTLLPTGGSTFYGYDDVNRAYSQTAFAAANAPAGKEISKVNGLGLVSRKESFAKNENGQDIYDVVEIEYDQFGRAKRTSNPFRSNENAHGIYWTEVFYDAIGRVWKTVAPDGSTKYDYFNETTRPQGASTEPGMTFRMKDPIGREKWYRTDSDGNIAEVIEPNPDGNGSVATGGYLTKYTYDRLKRLTQTEQLSQLGSQFRKFKYDSLGRLTHQKMAETGATLDESGNFVGNGNGVWSDFYIYDKLSNVVSYKDARGVSTNYYYQDPSNPTFPIDPLNRIFAISYNTNGAADVLPSPTINFSYQTSGNVSLLKTVTTTDVSTVELGYDNRGRINEKKTTLLSRASYPLVTNYIYDSLNRISDVIYPTQYGTGGLRKTVHNDFDSAGRTIGLKVDNTDYASSFVFNNFNQVTSIKIGPNGNNQITENYNYNQQTGLLERQQLMRGSTNLFDLSYEYQRCSCSTGGSGQITKIINNLDRNKDKTYEYDALARLKKVSGGINQAWSQTYAYDRFGNRTGVTALGVESLSREDSKSDDSLKQSDIIKGLIPSSLTPNAKKLLSDVENLTKINKSADKSEETKSSDDRQVEDRIQKTDSSKTKTQDSVLPPNKTPFDFDYDGKADYSVFQKTAGDWVFNQSGINQNTTVHFGLASDQIAPADYDGDGKTDTAIWRPATGDWYILRSSDGIVSIIHWGAKGDSVMPADYDGDGKADLAIWRPSTGEWYVLRSSNNSYYSLQFGNQLFGDIPATADYDGDGKADVAVWRPSNAAWYMILSSTGQIAYPTFGLSGDVPVPAKYDGDNKDDLAVWRPSTGEWFILLSTSGQSVTVNFGGQQYGDIPVSADYDGDGKADIAVWRQPTGTWYILQSSNGQIIINTFGSNGNIAVPSAYRRRSSAPQNQNKEIPRDGLAAVSYDPVSNRITNAGFTYDSAGNQTRIIKEDGTALRYQYDAAGRLVKIKSDSQQTIVTYTYGESRERLITQEGDENSTNRTYYAWEGGAVISEFADSASNMLTWTKNYVYLGGRLLATHEQIGVGERLQFNHADQLGTRVVTNPADGTSFEQATLPYGKALDSESSGSINRRFTSYDRSVSTGLDYAVNRFYDPSQGRFTTVDPIKFKASNLINPQTLNLYAYTANDPINRTDPDGQFWGFITGVFRFLFGGNTQFRFNFVYKNIPFSFGFQGHFRNIYVGVAGFNVQVTGQNSVFNLIKKFRDTKFEKCGGNQLTSTGFSEDAADLILQISKLEGVSPTALAVTWQNETDFKFYPKPNINRDITNPSNWDYGPFGVNFNWTQKYIKNGRLDITDILKSNGYGGSNVWGYVQYDYKLTSQFPKDPSKWDTVPFDGSPLANGRVAARRLKLNGGSEENMVKHYAPDPEERARRYNNWKNTWNNFFDCYKSN